MKKLKGLFKKLVDPKIYTLYEAGLIDDCLEITEEGKQELLELLLMENKDEMVARAKEVIKENKKRKKDEDDNLEEV